MRLGRSHPTAVTRVVGIKELLGATGIVLPVLTHIKLFLVPLAAIGFAALQVSAIVMHVRRGELSKTLWFNLLLLAASLFKAWGRW